MIFNKLKVASGAVAVMAVIAVLAFQAPKDAELQDEIWFEYTGPDPSLASSYDYNGDDYSPTCQEGQALCAIKASNDGNQPDQTDLNNLQSEIQGGVPTSNVRFKTP